MKYLYSLLLILFAVNAHSQTPYSENFGNPTAPTSVNLYTGWSNQTYTYTGTAEIQNTNPSNYNYASGAGNLYFTNSVGTYFQISGISNVSDVFASIAFGMYGYDTSNPTSLNELILSASLDSGVTWKTLPYHRMYAGFWAPKPWDRFTATLGQVKNTSRLMYKFTQSTSTKTFRIDDLDITFSVPLTTKLHDFNASANNNRATIKWNAFTNSDKEAFIIEKSSDGEVFSPLYKIQARGGGQFNYEYIDVVATKAFYRLKMINADGNVAYSNIITVKLNSQLVQQVYPTPARDVLQIRLVNNRQNSITLLLVDLAGKHRLRKAVSAIEGTSVYQVPLNGLEAGTYYLIAFTSDNYQMQRILITK